MENEKEASKSLIENDPIFKKVKEEFLKCIQDEEVMKILIAREKDKREVAARVDQAYRDGIIEGEGKGRIKVKHQTAQAMRAEGFDTKKIAEITGLSEEEISSI